MKRLCFSLRTGFTIIEMVVTIAVMGIIAAVVIVNIAPVQRISDARDSKAKQDVRQAASAVEACLSYTDPNSGVGNAADFCGVAGNLNSALQGGPFVRGSMPSAVSISYNGSVVCVWETWGSTTWKYTSAAGKVDVGTAACP